MTLSDPQTIRHMRGSYAARLSAAATARLAGQFETWRWAMQSAAWLRHQIEAVRAA